MTWLIVHNGFGYYHIYHVHDGIGASCYERKTEFSKNKNTPTCCLCDLIAPDSIMIQLKLLSPGGHGIKKELCLLDPADEKQCIGINYEGELIEIYPGNTSPITEDFITRAKALLDKFGVSYVDNERG